VSDESPHERGGVGEIVGLRTERPDVSDAVRPSAAGVTPVVPAGERASATVETWGTRTPALTTSHHPNTGAWTALSGDRPALPSLEPADDTVPRLEERNGGAGDGPLVPPGLVALVGYSRHDSDPLEHDVRARVYDLVRESPGTYPAAIVDRLGVSRSTVRYHLRVLEDEDLVSEQAVDGRRRYVAAEATAAERTLAAVDDGSTAGAVVEALARDGPATVSELAERLDRSPGTVTHHLNRLEDAGVVDRERDGQAVQNRLAVDVGPLDPAASAASEPFAATTDD
jgi:DNA-binding transcriptional ArsR family regulator